MYLSLPVPKPPHTVSVTVVPLDYPHTAMHRLDVAVPTTATFQELEQRIFSKLDRYDSDQSERTRFVFTDVWSERVHKVFDETQLISEIQQGDKVHAMQV